ncbi:putative protease S8 tripeptidyl peptidase I [Ramicandelaber brevisporus]|nr:putative protease S8 tripeptidyl peptidase I [Ramicandelaber brevisporus]
MIPFSLLLLILTIIQGILAVSNSFGQYVEFDRLGAAPSPWALTGPAPLDHSVNLQVGLKQQNVEQFNHRFMEMSTPGNPNYGKHMSRDELNAMLAPKDESVQMVLAWLKSYGIEGTHDNQWVKADATVDQAQRLLQTQFNTYRSGTSDVTTIRTLAYSIPQSLVDHVRIVSPVNFFEPVMSQPIITIPPQSTLRAGAAPASCNDQVTPECIQKLYGLPTTKATQKGNSVAIPGFLNEFANKADLAQYLKRFRSDLDSKTKFSEQFVDGGRNDQNKPGIEANLDVQTVIGLASGVPVSFVSGGLATMTGFKNVMNYLKDQKEPPSVISFSYGFNENSVSKVNAIELCEVFKKLGARGTSVIVASGDGGVAGSRPSDTCTNFVPTFPASCPHVTAVGATTGVHETGAALSAGGFSAHFDRPDYQNGAVSKYLKALGSQHQDRYEHRGRAYPDVSAQGVNAVIVLGGNLNLVEGTSYSAPVFASVVALLNDERIKAGKSKLGFLNPFLYSHPHALNDIAAGNNPSCGTNGFPAKAGWDPVTGLGTPNFKKLKAAALKL